MPPLYAQLNTYFMPSSSSTPTYRVPLIALTGLFFMWGFLRSMSDIIIPYFRKIFSLNYTESMLVQFCFLGAYFLGSLGYYLISYFKGDPIKRMGYKAALLLGIGLSTVGCLLFYPAASLIAYPLFLFALFVLGLGFTTLEITANAYVSLLGTPETSSARLNLTQAFNSLGTTLAPLFGGYMIFTLLAGPNGEPTHDSIKLPYLLFAAVFVLLGIVVLLVHFPSFFAKNAEKLKHNSGAWKFPQLRLGIWGIFFYNGAEAGIGSFIIVLLEQKMGMDASLAKEYLSLYWGGAMLGRFLAPLAYNKTLAAGKRIAYMSGIAILVFTFLFSIVHLEMAKIGYLLLFVVLQLIGFVLGKRSASLTLFTFASISAVLLLIGGLSQGIPMMFAFIAIGLFNSVMFSNIYTLAITGLGEHTSQGSSLLIMAILGGGVLSLLQGFLADKIGVQESFLLHVISYGYVAFFGWYCYKKLRIR